MALIPFAEKKLIPPGSNDPDIIPIGFIFHVDAGNARDLFGFFRDRSGGIESHCHIRKDGHLYQYRDTGSEADANYKANSFIGADGRRYGYISVETQGYEHGEWTPEQIETMQRLIRWGHGEHDIPYAICSNPRDPGSGYHTMFGAPSAWTPVSKSCPGPDRKNQFNHVLAPWIRAQDTNDSTPINEEDTMSWRENIAFWRITKRGNEPKEMWAGQQLNQARGYSEEASRRALIAVQEARSTRAAVAALAKAMGPTVEAAVNEALKDAVIDVDVTVQKGA